MNCQFLVETRKKKGMDKFLLQNVSNGCPIPIKIETKFFEILALVVIWLNTYLLNFVRLKGKILRPELVAHKSYVHEFKI